MRTFISTRSPIYRTIALSGALLVASEGCAPRTQIAQVRCPSTRPADPAGARIARFDLVEIIGVGLTRTGEVSRWQRRVNQDGNVVLPWIGPVHLEGVRLIDAPGVLHQACIQRTIDFDDWVGVWKLQGIGSNITPTQISPRDRLLITIGDLKGTGIDSDVALYVSDDGKIDLPEMGTISVTGLTEQQIETAINLKMPEPHDSLVMVRKVP